MRCGVSTEVLSSSRWREDFLRCFPTAYSLLSTLSRFYHLPPKWHLPPSYYPKASPLRSAALPCLPLAHSPADPLSPQQHILLPRGAEGADQMSNAIHVSKTPAAIALILYLFSTLVLWIRTSPFRASKRPLLTLLGLRLFNRLLPRWEERLHAFLDDWHDL
jgi:hypothetical protein